MNWFVLGLEAGWKKNAFYVENGKIHDCFNLLVVSFTHQ